MKDTVYAVTLLDKDTKLGYIYKTAFDPRYSVVLACSVIDTMKRDKGFRDALERELGEAYGAIFPKFD